MVIEERVKLFKALSDPNRLRILKMLQQGRLCVCEITGVLELAASTVSEHLSLLKRAGFIIEEKEGKWVYYMLNLRSSDPAIMSILSMLPFWITNDETINNDLGKINTLDRMKLCCK